MEKKEKSTTDEEWLDQNDDKLCKSIIKGFADTIVSNTQYWKRLEHKNNTSYAMMTSLAKNSSGMKCAELVNKN